MFSMPELVNVLHHKERVPEGRLKEKRTRQRERHSSEFTCGEGQYVFKHLLLRSQRGSDYERKDKELK